MLEIGRDGLYRMDYATMRDWAPRALDAARPLGDRGLVAAAAARRRARAARSTGDRRRPSAAADEARGARRRACPTRSSRADLDFAGNALAAAEILLDRYAAGSGTPSARWPSREATGQGQRPAGALLGRARPDDGGPPARGRRGARHRDRDRPRRRARQGMMWNLFARALHRAARGRQRDGARHRRARRAA